MKHNHHILLVGFQNQLDIESIPGISISKCQLVQQATESVIKENFDLIISKFQIEASNAIELHQSLDSIKKYYSGTSPKNFKFLIITSSIQEEEVCKQNQVLFYPDSMNLRSLVLKLIDLPKEPKRNDKKPAIIDFKELFIRVDNNREFIQTVIEKFFEIRDSRIQDIRVPLQNKEFKKAKDAAHKLKGVLANFSMQEARATIIELEKLILEHDLAASTKKLEELVLQIEKAKDFYNQNLDVFKN